jgi:hypothetical protein
VKASLAKLAVALALATAMPAIPAVAKAPETPEVERVSPHRWIGPAKAIRLVKTNSMPVAGVFVITVQATGRIDNKIYLNSKPDYKDPACLTIEIQPVALRELADRLGGDVQEKLQGKTIAVWGAVVRVPIAMDDAPKKVVYQQTHVIVTDPKEVRIVSADEQPVD